MDGGDNETTARYTNAVARDVTRSLRVTHARGMSERTSDRRGRVTERIGWEGLWLRSTAPVYRAISLLFPVALTHITEPR
jgi:hypothetical protein